MSIGASGETAALASEPQDVQRVFALLADMFSGLRPRGAVSGEAFAADVLGEEFPHLVIQRAGLTAAQRLGCGSLLTELVATHNATLGPGEDTSSQAKWQRFALGGDHVTVLVHASTYFPSGTLAEVDVVVRISDNAETYLGQHELQVCSRAADQAAAAELLTALLDRARTDYQLLRGRFLHADEARGGGVDLAVLDAPTETRADVIVDPEVWAELDLNVAASTTRRELMQRTGLGTRRGALLVGPPGVGKTAVVRVLAAELLALGFTVITVAPAMARSDLAAVYDEADGLTPVAVLLDDLDLIAGVRRDSESDLALAGLLTALDGTSRYPDVLTLATTNDPAALDSATTRSARFDSIIEIPTPDTAAAQAILNRYLSKLDHHVDTTQIAEDLPPGLSGADLREIIRRAVLTHGENLDTAAVRDIIEGGRFHAELPSETASIPVEKADGTGMAPALDN